MNKKPFSILFVCTGNICRSPTAEAVFRHEVRKRKLTEQFHHDSAGVDSHHIGQAPDPRSQKATLEHGAIDMSDLRARNMRPQDFYEFDLILAMDESHLKALKRMAPKGSTATIAKYLPHCASDGCVPDPYYGKKADFDHVYKLIETATDRLLAKHS